MQISPRVAYPPSAPKTESLKICDFREFWGFFFDFQAFLSYFLLFERKAIWKFQRIGIQKNTSFGCQKVVRFFIVFKNARHTINIHP